MHPHRCMSTKWMIEVEPYCIQVMIIVLTCHWSFLFSQFVQLWWILLISQHLLMSIKAEPTIMISIHIRDVLMTYICDSDVDAWYILSSSLFPHCCYQYCCLLWHMQCTFMVPVSIEYLDYVIGTPSYHPSWIYTIWYAHHHSSRFWLRINSIHDKYK